MPDLHPALPAVNRLIDRLPRRHRDRLLEQCTPVQLVFGDVLSDARTPAKHVYFPLTGFISLVASVSGQPPLEMGMIGNEGMLGATVALGVSTTPLRALVQGSGSARRLPIARFRRELSQCAELRRTLDSYLFVLYEQLAQTAACNSYHEVQARLARWLLMTHDRAHGMRFRLTHQFLAEMLGVRRSAVTIAAGGLQRRRLIQYSRGKISVLSRPGLEAASCECYAAAVDAYDRRLPVTARGGVSIRTRTR